MLLNRRGFMVGAAGAATGIALGSRSGFAAESVQLRAMWWGSNDRSKRTLAVAKLFEEKNPDIRIIGESLSGDGYWTKLATQMAGRRHCRYLPARAQHDFRLFKARRLHGARPLHPFGARSRRLWQGRAEADHGGRKALGIGLGLNSFALFYDPMPSPKPASRPRDRHHLGGICRHRRRMTRRPARRMSGRTLWSPLCLCFRTPGSASVAAASPTDTGLAIRRRGGEGVVCLLGGTAQPAAPSARYPDARPEHDRHQLPGARLLGHGHGLFQPDGRLSAHHEKQARYRHAGHVPRRAALRPINYRPALIWSIGRRRKTGSGRQIHQLLRQ